MKLPVAAQRALRFGVLAGVLAALTVTPVAAADGQPILAGQTNSESADATVVQNTSTYPNGCEPFLGYGMVVCGDAGVLGLGSATGVLGEGLTGVSGQSDTDGGTGVLGSSATSTGIGVEGESSGSGSGVYGLANSNGVGVFGDTSNGTGVLARSTNGTALDVRGKATFSRSGQVTVAAGTASTKVTLAGVTTASMILATAQRDGTVFVRSAVPAAGSFTIHLTGKAPAGGLKVAYFVLN